MDKIDWNELTQIHRHARQFITDDKSSNILHDFEKQILTTLDYLRSQKQQWALAVSHLHIDGIEFSISIKQMDKTCYELEKLLTNVQVVSSRLKSALNKQVDIMNSVLRDEVLDYGKRS